MSIKKRHNISIFFAVVAIVSMLLLPSCYGNTINFKKEKLEINNIIDDTIILDGDIIAEVDDNKLKFVRPLITLIDEQSIYFNLTKIDAENYLINRTLRIDINVINGTNDSTLFGRYMTTCIVLRRKNPSFADGFLKNLFIGKILNINRTNVFSEGEKYIEIPLIYETDKDSENIVMHVLAIGTILGVASKGQPVIAHKKIDLEFIYLSDNPQDTTPPITICILEGKEI